jgi:putative transposase
MLPSNRSRSPYEDGTEPVTVQVGRDHVARLMGELGICGVVRGAKRRTTTPAASDQRPTDLVNRDFTAPAPIACGSPISPTWPPGPGSAMPRSSSTPTAAPSSAGGWRPPCGQSWRWTPWRWPSGPARTPNWTGWCITATAGCSPIPVHPLHRTPGRGSGHLGRLGRRQLRQRARRGGQRAGQGGADRPPWPLADRRAGRAGHPGMGQWWNQRRLHGALDHIPPAEHEAIYYREHQQSKEVA